MLFNRFFLLLFALVAILLAEQNHFSNFGRGSSKEHFCEIILKSTHWPWLLRPLCSAEQNNFSNFGTGHFVQRSRTILAILERFCEIILKSAHWPWRRCCFIGFSIFSSGGHFVQRSRTILAIFEKLHRGIISMKLF